VPLIQGQAGDLLVPGAEHHAVNAFSGGASGLAKTGRHVCQIEQFDHHMFEHVTGPGAFIQPLQKAAPFTDAAVMFKQGWKQGCQPVIETGQPVAGKVFE